MDWNGWKSVSLKSGDLEAVLPLEVGPRVLGLQFQGGENWMYLFPDEIGGKAESEYKLRGGHRLWHSPEHPVRTYQADNTPPQMEERNNGSELFFSATPEEKTGMQKCFSIETWGKNTFRLYHSLKNEGLWPVKAAAWTLTMLAKGGYAVIPLPAKGEHPRDLLPSYSLVPWTYTDLSLPSWKFHRDFIGVETQEADRPQKLGITSFPGWSAYWRPDGTFIKAWAVLEGESYPDFGCCFETFTCPDMIELEALSPIRELQPGEDLDLVEYWTILPPSPKPDHPEVYKQSLFPAVQEWLETLPLS